MFIDRARFGLALQALVLGLLTASPVQGQRLYEDFILAVANDRVDQVRDMVDRGMDPNTVSPSGDPVLMVAIQTNSDGALNVLLKAGAKVDVVNRNGDSPLMVAALNGKLPLVKRLVTLGAPVNRTGWTPLIYAATNGHSDVVAYLIDAGANVNAESPNGSSALMMATRGRFQSTVELLIAKGATVNHRNQDGATALTWAKTRDYSEIAAVLRARGGVE